MAVDQIIKFGRTGRFTYTAAMASYLRKRCDFELREPGELRFTGQTGRPWLIILENAPDSK